MELSRFKCIRLRQVNVWMKYANLQRACHRKSSLGKSVAFIYKRISSLFKFFTMFLNTFLINFWYDGFLVYDCRYLSRVYIINQVFNLNLFTHYIFTATLHSYSSLSHVVICPLFYFLNIVAIVILNLFSYIFD